MRRSELVNLEINADSRNPLYPQEIEMLIGLVARFISVFPLKVSKGYLVLDGQRDGEEASKIFSFELKDGATIGGVDKAEEANDAIDYVLQQSKKRDFLTGVNYIEVDQRVLVLPVEGGRFLASCNFEFVGDHYYRENILLLLAAAIARLRGLDKEVKKSIEKISHHYGDFTAGFLRNAFALNFFAEMAAWKVWNGVVVRNGRFKGFFE